MSWNMKFTKWKSIFCLYLSALVVYLFLYYGIMDSNIIHSLRGNNYLRETTLLRNTFKQEKTHIAFLKVHKSGSTTVQNILFRFGWRKKLNFILPNNSSFYPNVISLSETLMDSNILPPPDGKTFDVLCCHVIYNRTSFERYLPGDSVYIGIVRDPYQQFLSIIRYFRPMNVLGENRDGDMHQFLSNPRPYEEEFVGYSMTNNRMAYEFGFPLELFKTHNKSEIQRYLDILDKEFQLVIINEYFDESMVLMKRLLNWDIKDIIYISQNVDKERKSRFREMTQTERKLYRNWAALDFALYDYFVDRLWKQIMQYGKDIFDEIRHYKLVKKEINLHCSQRVAEPFYVEASTWNSPFSFTSEDCWYAALYEQTFLDGIRRSQYDTKQPPLTNIFTRPHVQTENCEGNENSWTFSCKRHCPEMPSRKTPSQQRLQILLECNMYILKDAHVSDYQIPTYDSKNTCIDDVISRNCKDALLVPNIVHYVWFGKREMNFYHFLAVMSIHKKQKPCLILFHSDYLPFGQYWEYLLQLVPNIIHVQVKPETMIAGKRIKFVEHKADYARLKAVKRFGGIYTDTDTIVLRSLDPLRNYNFTLSKAFDFNLSNGLILSAPNATFLKYWFKAYETYDPDKWGFHSTIIPFKIWQSHLNETGLIHVEEKTFVRPNGIDAPKQIFHENFNWSQNYAIHMFIRFNKTVHNFKDIRYLNTTVGSVSRFILLDNKELCVN